MKVQYSIILELITINVSTNFSGIYISSTRTLQESIASEFALKV